MTKVQKPKIKQLSNIIVSRQANFYMSDSLTAERISLFDTFSMRIMTLINSFPNGESYFRGLYQNL